MEGRALPQSRARKKYPFASTRLDSLTHYLKGQVIMRSVHDPFAITQIRAPRVAPKIDPVPDFFADSLCREPEEFLWDWSIDGETPMQRTKRLRRAVDVCQDCPLMQQCRDFAATERWACGVWGGEVLAPRREIEAAEICDEFKENSKKSA